MASTTLPFRRGANAPAVLVAFTQPGGAPLDLSGSGVEILVRASRDAAPVTLSTSGVAPRLSIQAPATAGIVAIAYDDAFLATLKTGTSGRWDAYAVGTGRAWIGGGIIKVYAAGEAPGDDVVQVMVPGPQGIPGGMTPEFAAAYAAVLAIFGAASAPPKTIETATYAVLSDDLGRVLRFTQACVVTLPAGLPAGWYCVLRRLGGAVTWVAAAGATKFEYPAGTGIAAQRASVTVSVDANEGGAAAVWMIEGAIL